MLVARIIFKSSRGWSTDGRAYRKAETVEELQQFAEKKANGREYIIKIEECYKHFENEAEEV